MLADNLVMLRNLKGLTQEQVAESNRNIQNNPMTKVGTRCLSYNRTKLDETQ